MGMEAITPTAGDGAGTGREIIEHEDEDHYWLPGQAVIVTGLTDETELNGRSGSVTEEEDQEGRMLVRVHLPWFEIKDVRLKREYLRFVEEGDEARVDVIWTYTRRLNTGMRGEFAEVMADAYAAYDDEENSLRQISCTISELHEFVSRMRFEQCETPLLTRIGVRVACYAHPHEAAEENGGRDNVLATYLTLGTEERQPQRKVVGTAFFARLSPSSGEIVDFPLDEALRLLMFVNDVLPLYDDPPSTGLSEDACHAFLTCLPFYDIGCKMAQDGFSGIRTMKRLEDGSFVKDPDNMEPVSTHAK